MSALVKTVKSRLTNNTIYPVTKADAVYMGSSTTSTVEGQINIIEGQINILNTNVKHQYVSSSITIAASSTEWISIPIDSSLINPKLYGYYIQGTGNSAINIYGILPILDESRFVFGIRNSLTNSSATITITIYVVANN